MRRLTHLKDYKYGYEYTYKNSEYTQTFIFLNKPTTRKLITEINQFKHIAKRFST